MPRVGNDRIRPTGAAQAQVDATPRALRVINYNAAGGVGGPVTILDGAGGGTLARVDAINSAMRSTLYGSDGAPIINSPSGTLRVVNTIVVNTVLPSASVDGTGLIMRCDNIGRALVAPYSFPENYVRGVIGPTAGPATITLIAAPAVGSRLHLTSLSVGTSTAVAGAHIFEDSAGVFIEIPSSAFAGGFYHWTYPTPVRLTDNRALLFIIPVGGVAWASAQGYIGR